MSVDRITAVPQCIIKPVSLPKFTLEEYFEIDAASERPLEYFDGVVTSKDGVYTDENGATRAMMGATAQHCRITGNICVHLDRAFDNRECEVYFSNIRTRISPTQYRYPDVIAVCGGAEFDDRDPPALLNPMVIVEVLSPSTQNIDRGEKWDEYRALTTLTNYVLVAQDHIFVTHYVRRSATQWIVTNYSALTDTLTLASVGVSMTLAEIYRKVAFAPPATLV